MHVPRSISSARSLVFVLSAVIQLALPGTANAAAPGVQDGDLFAGDASGIDAGGPIPPFGIKRVRGAAITPFCVGPTDPADPGFFHAPQQVISDSQGRVVFIAGLGYGEFDHIGLFRCSGEGATPERLAIFRVGSHALEAGYPDPFPSYSFVDARALVGLHLATRVAVSIDDDVNGGFPQVVTEDTYVMGGMAGAFGSGNSSFTPFTFVYGTVTDHWEETIEPIAWLGRYRTADMINKSGETWSIDDENGLKRVREPLKIALDGHVATSAGSFDFSVALSLFLSVQEVRGALLDNTAIPNVPSGCSPGLPDPPSLLMPSENGGFTPMAGFGDLVNDPSLGIAIQSNHGGVAPLLTQVTSHRLNDDPTDDLQAFFYHWINCSPFEKLDVTRLVPAGTYSDPDGDPYSVNQDSLTVATALGGLVGLQRFVAGRVVQIAAGSVTELATGLSDPHGLAAYPPYAPSAPGVVVVVRIDSPVDLLLTDPQGRRIGTDPGTGATLNEFGSLGHVGAAGDEPRFIAVRDADPGAWRVQRYGKGTGQYTIHVYGIDLGQTTGSHALVAAETTAGEIGGGDFSLGPAHAVAFADGDGDAVADLVDNCPHHPNAVQSDVGGVGAGSAPDGIGDACQCGDVDDDGRVTGLDGTFVKRAALNLAPFSTGVGALADPNKCDVGGGSTGDATFHCSGLDGTLIQRASLALPPGVQQVCAPALP